MLKRGESFPITFDHWVRAFVAKVRPLGLIPINDSEGDVELPKAREKAVKTSSRLCQGALGEVRLIEVDRKAVVYSDGRVVFKFQFFEGAGVYEKLRFDKDKAKFVKYSVG